MTEDQLKDVVRKYVALHARDVDCIYNSDVVRKTMKEDSSLSLNLSEADAEQLSQRVEALVASANIAVSVTWDGDKPSCGDPNGCYCPDSTECDDRCHDAHRVCNFHLKETGDDDE